MSLIEEEALPDASRTPAIRRVVAADIEPLKAVIAATDMFEPGLLDDMAAAYLSGQSSELWLTAEEVGPKAVAFCAPERLADGTWNLLLIAVHPDQQGRGIGTALVACVEQELQRREQRVLIVETSGMDAFRRTQDFYLRCGYTREARIRDFYGRGDDKVVFWKSLT